MGGKWRSRRLPVLDREGLRPTPDRIRETLFNWLQPRIGGARCLDLFAGTGALGIEAVSRGAAGAVLVEEDPRLCRQLQANIEALDAGEITVVNAKAFEWLRKNRECFDLIFLDPPFGRGLIETGCQLIHETGCVAADGMIYIEAEPTLLLPPFLKIHKQGHAGQVMYLLAGLV